MILKGPYRLNNTNNRISLPPSKSEQVRLLIAYRLAGVTDSFEDILTNEDAISANNVGIQLYDIINGKTDSLTIDCGESGISMHIAAFIAATIDKPITLIGRKTLAKRNITPLIQALDLCGIEYSSQKESIENFLPITINGTIQKREIEISAELSTQPITGLLFAAPFLAHDTTTSIVLSHPQKIPYLINPSNFDWIDRSPIYHDEAAYIKTTEAIIKFFGIECNTENYTFYIQGGQKYLRPEKEFIVANDGTCAGYFTPIGLLAGELHFEERIGNLHYQFTNSIYLSNILKDLADITLDEKYGYIKTVAPSKKLKPFIADVKSFPDLVPALLALACTIDGISTIHGFQRLRYKETDRVIVLANEFQKCGAKIDVYFDKDLIMIKGGNLQSCTIHSFGDHRVAMAAAILPARDDIEIELIGTDCVKKSFPEFFDIIEKFMN